MPQWRRSPGIGISREMPADCPAGTPKNIRDRATNALASGLPFGYNVERRGPVPNVGLARARYRLAPRPGETTRCVASLASALMLSLFSFSAVGLVGCGRGDQGRGQEEGRDPDRHREGQDRDRRSRRPATRRTRPPPSHAPPPTRDSAINERPPSLSGGVFVASGRFNQQHAFRLGIAIALEISPIEVRPIAGGWTTRGDRTMAINAQELQGQWNQLKGQVKEKWGQLTDDDLPSRAATSTSSSAGSSRRPARAARRSRSSSAT